MPIESSSRASLLLPDAWASVATSIYSASVRMGVSLQEARKTTSIINVVNFNVANSDPAINLGAINLKGDAPLQVYKNVIFRPNVDFVILNYD